MRKVAYRLPGTTRLVWAIVLAQREGLSLLFVQKPDSERSHCLAIAAEDVEQRLFHDVPASRFSMEEEDLVGIGMKLEALGERFAEAEVQRFFRREDSW